MLHTTISLKPDLQRAVNYVIKYINEKRKRFSAKTTAFFNQFRSFGLTKNIPSLAGALCVLLSPTHRKTGVGRIFSDAKENNDNIGVFGQPRKTLETR